MRLVLAVIALALLNGSRASAAEPSATAVVARLYHDFAFELLQPPGFEEPGLADQPVAVLERYFTPELARLIHKDFLCRERTHEVCNLEAVFLFDSQDPAAYNLQIEPAGRDVRASFLLPNGWAKQPKVTIKFKMVHTKSGWRIADMAYAEHGMLSAMLKP